jgi:transcriptional regulator with XRE-family HTH domain
MPGSSVPLRRLGSELRRLREAAGCTQKDIADAIDRTPTTIANWEHGKTKIAKADLAVLLAQLRAPVSLRKDLERLHDEATKGGWWSGYGVSEWLRSLLGFERDAVEVDLYDPIIVPGLLQTASYAEAIVRADPFTAPPRDVPKWIAVRMERQKRLSEPEPLRVRAVVSEAALRLEVGGPAVMAEQVSRLLADAERPSISIRVLPVTAGATSGVSGNLVVLHFADPKLDPPMGYFDTSLGGCLTGDAGDVEAMRRMLGDLEDLALSDVESRDMLMMIRNDYAKRRESDG